MKKFVYFEGYSQFILNQEDAVSLQASVWIRLFISPDQGYWQSFSLAGRSSARLYYHFWRHFNYTRVSGEAKTGKAQTGLPHIIKGLGLAETRFNKTSRSHSGWDVKGTHTVYLSSSLYIINQKPMIHRTDFHCITTWVARSSGWNSPMHLPILWFCVY